MSTTTRLGIVLLLGGAMALAVACEEKGPAEKAGEQIDDAAEDAGEALDEAAEEAGKALEDAGKALSGD